jgi:hypothetical protein
MSTTHLDGARVLHTAKGEFGLGLNNEPITALMIAHYDNDHPDAFYLFACNGDGEVVGDLFYTSVAEARSDAERFYETSPIHWEDA